MNQALTGRQLELVRKTVATDCDAAEFDLFTEVVKRLGLDPFRRQVMPLVFSKSDPSKRRMSIVVGLDGQRILAQRCGDYRPASEPAKFEIDETLKGTDNPDGLVGCTTYLHKQDNTGAWFPVVGEARWSEFAPLKTVWKDNKPTDGVALDYKTQWPRMPRIMLLKCATMQALRAGWPDEFSGVYGEEEMDQAKSADLDATALIEAHQEELRQKQIGSGNDILIAWLPGMPLESIPVGEMYDRISEWAIDPTHTPEMVEQFRDINRIGLRQFWAMQPGDALALKKVLEPQERDPADLHVLEAG